MKVHDRSRKLGFTLVELVIVLVIIGLLIGGVITGRELMKTQELRNVMTSMTSMGTAAKQFQIKYGALPGDFADGVTTFGASSIDGDGNGSIGSAEMMNVANHLALGGFITGKYTPTSNPPEYWTLGRQYQVGYNVMPAGGGNKLAFLVMQTRGDLPASGTGFPDSFLPPGQMGTPVMLWDTCDSSFAGCSQGALLPADAYYLDNKYDDGNAFNGNIIGFINMNGPVQTAVCSTDAYHNGAYQLNSTNVHGCALLLKTGL